MDQQNQRPHVSQETLLIRHDFWEELSTMTLKKVKRGTKKKTENKKRKKNITEKKEIRRNQKDNICNSLF